MALPELAPSPVPTLADALADEEEGLLTCVHCGFCLPACPTYTALGDENDSPRGRLYLMRAVVEGRLDAGSDAFQTHIDRCLGCRACEPVCPSGVPYGSLLELARSEAVRARRPSMVVRLLLGIVEGPRRLEVFGLLSRGLRWTRIPALLARFLPARPGLEGLRLAFGMLAGSGGWTGRRGAGREEGGRDRDGERQGPGGRPGPEEHPGQEERPAWGERRDAPEDVGLLLGCVQERLAGGVNRATERVLGANGFQVRTVEGQGCCGALHAHAGELAKARDMARRNIDAFEGAGVETVVVNAAGCGAILKEYGHLLAGDPAYASRATRLSARVRDISEVLASRGPRRGAEVRVRVAYDAPCHLLHAQGVEAPPLQVLASIPGLELAPMEGSDRCCGGAGIYGLNHPELGGRFAGDKASAARRCGAEVVATGNPGCAMQIGAGLRIAGEKISVAHPVELVDESYRRAGYYGRGAAGGTRPEPPPG